MRRSVDISMYNVILHGIVIVLAAIFYNNKDKLFQDNSWIPFAKSKNTSFLDDPEFSNNRLSFLDDSFRFYKDLLDHGYFSAQGMWQEKIMKLEGIIIYLTKLKLLAKNLKKHVSKIWYTL